jgi:osmotically-inducible protein OsmY
VAVDGGVVTLDAAVSPLSRRLFEGLARTVPGVVEVRTSQAAEDDRR